MKVMKVLVSFICMMFIFSGSVFSMQWSEADLKRGASWNNRSGYSFDCMKYNRTNVIQGCFKEETRYWNHCKDLNRNEMLSCMANGHKAVNRAYHSYAQGNKKQPQQRKPYQWTPDSQKISKEEIEYKEISKFVQRDIDIFLSGIQNNYYNNEIGFINILNRDWVAVRNCITSMIIYNHRNAGINVYNTNVSVDLKKNRGNIIQYCIDKIR